MEDFFKNEDDGVDPNTPTEKSSKILPKENITPEPLVEGLAYHSDPIFYRRVAYILGAIAGFALLSIVALSVLNQVLNHEKPLAVPDALTALGSVAVGALAGLFGSHGKNRI
jgi:hypothetical protein